MKNSVVLSIVAALAIGVVAHATPQNENIDSLGCGDGVKSEPNGWFVGISKNDPNMFQETAMLSVNLFNITSVSGAAPDNGTVGLTDVSKISSVIYEVTFQPGVDSIGYPTAHADTIKNRDTVLLALKKLGATIDCNNILPIHHH